MCGALEELVNEGVQRGRQEGRIEGLQEGILKGQLEGIQANIRTCKTFKISKSDTIKNVAKEFSLSEDEAKDYVEKYWQESNITRSMCGAESVKGSAPVLFFVEKVKGRFAELVEFLY